MFEEIATTTPATTRGLLALLHLECDESLCFPWDVMSTVIRLVIDAKNFLKDFDDLEVRVHLDVLYPSLVHQNVILLLIKGRDCVIQAQSVTPATASV